jgi:hypothetical protein
MKGLVSLTNSRILRLSINNFRQEEETTVDGSKTFNYIPDETIEEEQEFLQVWIVCNILVAGSARV